MFSQTSSKAGQATPLCRRAQRNYGVSLRRICQTFRFNRKSMQYAPKTTVINELLRLRIKEMAQTRVRYEYRRIHVLLRREGWKVNPKRIARLYRWSWVVRPKTGTGS